MEKVKNIIKCSECSYCKPHTRATATRKSFYCEHPNYKYICEYFTEHRIQKMYGFLGFGAKFSNEVPLKTSPAWCPKKAEVQDGKID